ncbi:MAG: 3-deoxy-7-phosphoheptulonate synthase [Cardiobacteriaceae bacterium]|nr:3-deoxy-7-phosphoheptulonate synthase [Cardiobacteriaceae bacterium]
MDIDLHNLRIERRTALLSPNELSNSMPLPQQAKNTILRGREDVRQVLDRKDDRKMIIAGPCSIHDTRAAIEYAAKLQKLSEQVKDKFLILMRVYFEKPRTSIGWKGLINDPDLNGSFDIAKGLKIARRLLIDINAIGLPCATEALDPITPQYIGDLISWTAIGARTSESQTHRELASGLSTPVGFKNATDGSLEIAINAIKSASQAHSFLGIDEDGATAEIRSKGNRYGHIVLRGGSHGPNYDSVNIKLATEELLKNKLAPNIIIDCSHANSYKQHERQIPVFQNVMAQIAAGEENVVGLMLESNLNAGSQSLSDSKDLQYGVSITDACIDWQSTEKLILQAAEK